MTARLPTRAARRVAAVAQAVASVAVGAWVGGFAALGAFTARIVFRDLPRGIAAPTMNAIFRSFDRAIAVAVAVLAAATLARVVALRGEALRGAPGVATAASVGLLGCGLASITWVDPAIERMFQDGATLLPRFAALHTMSERLGHLEVSLTVILFAAFAWPSSTRADHGSTHDEAGEPDERDRIGTASMRESAR